MIVNVTVIAALPNYKLYDLKFLYSNIAASNDFFFLSWEQSTYYTLYIDCGITNLTCFQIPGDTFCFCCFHVREVYLYVFLSSTSQGEGAVPPRKAYAQAHATN